MSYGKALTFLHRKEAFAPEAQQLLAVLRLSLIHIWQDVPSVIVVPVDYSENMKLSEHLKEVYTKKQEAII